MKRKIIKLGTATLVASIPSKWIKQFNLKQGDEIEVEEKGNELILSTSKHSDSLIKEIDITGLYTKLVAKYLLSAYVLGYDEVKVRFESPEIMDLKKNAKVPVLSFMQNFVNTKLIGIEIIEQKSGYCVLKDLTGIADNEFDIVTRRIFLLIMSMADELFNNINNMDSNKAKDVISMRENIDRFCVFCLRILNKKGHPNFSKTSFYYHIIMQLRAITQVYEYIGKELDKREKPVCKDLIAGFENLNLAFKAYYESFYKPNKDKSQEVVKRVRAYYDETANKIQYNPKSYVQDVLLVGRLSMIAYIYLDLIEFRIGLEL